MEDPKKEDLDAADMMMEIEEARSQFYFSSAQSSLGREVAYLRKPIRSLPGPTVSSLSRAPSSLNACFTDTSPLSYSTTSRWDRCTRLACIARFQGLTSF